MVLEFKYLALILCLHLLSLSRADHCDDIFFNQHTWKCPTGQTFFDPSNCTGVDLSKAGSSDVIEFPYTFNRSSEVNVFINIPNKNNQVHQSKTLKYTAFAWSLVNSNWQQIGNTTDFFQVKCDEGKDMCDQQKVFTQNIKSVGSRFRFQFGFLNSQNNSWMGDISLEFIFHPSCDDSSSAREKKPLLEPMKVAIVVLGTFFGLAIMGFSILFYLKCSTKRKKHYENPFEDDEGNMMELEE